MLGWIGLLCAAVLLLSAPAGALSPFAQQADVAYLASNHVLYRYDLAAHAWLPAIALGGSARGLLVDAESAFLLYEDGRLVRRDHASGVETTLVADAGALSQLGMDGDFLFGLSGAGTVSVFDDRTGALVDQREYLPGMDTFHVAPASRRLVGFDWYEGPFAIPYDESGALGEAFPAPTDPAPYYAALGWVVPEADVYVDAWGSVFRAEDLSPVGYLGVDVRDLASGAGRMVARSGHDLVLVDDSFARVARTPAPTTMFAMAVTQDEVVVFSAPTQPAPAFATHLPWEAFDFEIITKRASALGFYGGVAWFGDSSGHVLLPWSLEEGRWLAPRPLPGYFLDLDASNGRLLLSRRPSAGTQELVWVSVSSPAEEMPLAGLDGTTCGGAVLGRAFAVCTTAPGAQYRLLTLDEAGGVLSELRFDERVGGLVWEPARRRLYLSVGSRLHWVDVDGGGRLQGVHATDLRGGRVSPSPDGSRLAIDWSVYDASTLDRLALIADGPVAWLGLDLLAASDWTDTVEWWTPELTLRFRTSLPGSSGPIVAVGERAVMVRFDDAGEPRVFTLGLDDFDGDAVPNAEDAFPLNYTEWSDRDQDGVGDNRDVFPDDPSESSDRDGDGVGDSSDWRPDDPAETHDSDGDDVGDNADAFPLDPEETSDFDGDGIGDHADPFPLGEPRIALRDLAGTQSLRFPGLGVLEAPLAGHLGLLENGTFTLCDESGCLAGVYRERGRSGRRFELQPDPSWVAGLAAVVEGAESALRDFFGGYVDVVANPEPGTLRWTLRVNRRGEAKVRFRIRFDVTLEDAPKRFRRLPVTWRWDFEPAPLAQP